MPWTKELETGITQVDEQHHWLVDLTNKLYDSVNNDKADTIEIGNILESLVDYTINHFIAEEAIFANLAYSESACHIKQHNHFTQRVYSLLERYEAGDTNAIGEEALDLLKNWLTNHIMIIDKDYIPLFEENNIH